KVYCGWRIDRAIKSRKMSDKLKIMHGNALKMLIAQTLNPILLFSLPNTVNIIAMLSGIDFGNLPQPLALMYGLFPIVNPIIVIWFTDDYRKNLFGRSSGVSLQV
ncbi:hypothetical protein PMAYCL1PPCAC_16341, partial [Pristionchus mayeri]